MTKDEISKIKEHIEIHFRREPRAVKITEILWRAVGELEHIAELEKENTGLKLKLEALDGQTPWKDIKDKSELIKENAELEEQNKKLLESCEGATMMYEDLCKAKEIIKKYMRFKPVVGGVQYYHEEYKQTEKEAEQFLNSEVSK